MPLYEYQCQDCGTKSEVLQRFSDDPLTTCKVCGGSLKKLISAPAVQFKGSGWYITDYAKSGDRKSGGEAGGGNADAGASSSKDSSSDSASGSKDSAKKSTGKSEGAASGTKKSA